jgi:hypothetical protein
MVGGVAGLGHHVAIVDRKTADEHVIDRQGAA